jgi:hypothetical protein
MASSLEVPGSGRVSLRIRGGDAVRSAPETRDLLDVTTFGSPPVPLYLGAAGAAVRSLGARTPAEVYLGPRTLF